MTTPPDDEQASTGAPNPPGTPADGSSGSRSAPSGSPSNSPPRVVAAAQDALARLLDRRASPDGAHTGALLRALVDASPLAMWVLDPDGRVVLWNHAAEIGRAHV